MTGPNNNTGVQLARSILATYCIFLRSFVGNLCLFSLKLHTFVHFLVYALPDNFYRDQISELF